MTAHVDSWPYLAWLTQTFHDLLDVGHLATMSVGVIGLRCMGDLAANLLVRLGIGGITLVESEQVDVPDLGVLRTLRDLGKARLSVVGNDLLAINPHLHLTRVAGDISGCSDDEVRHLARSVDALLCMVHDSSIHDRINAAAYMEVPTVHATIGGRDVSGRVIWTRPRSTACWRCCTKAESHRAAVAQDHTPHLPFDALSVVTMTVQIVLGGLLRGRRGSELFERLLVAERNMILIANRRENWLTERLPEEIVSAAATVDTTAARRRCPVCGVNP